MKLLADESVDGPIVELLRQDGHEVLYIAEIHPGISDSNVLDIANQEKCTLLTADKDFGELIFRQERISTGIILIRLAGFPPLKKAVFVATLLNQHRDEIQRAFTVISPTSIRIRKT